MTPDFDEWLKQFHEDSPLRRAPLDQLKRIWELEKEGDAIIAQARAMLARGLTDAEVEHLMKHRP